MAARPPHGARVGRFIDRRRRQTRLMQAYACRRDIVGGGCIGADTCGSAKPPFDRAQGQRQAAICLERLEKPARFVKLKPWTARMESRWVPVAEVAEEIGFDATGRYHLGGGLFVRGGWKELLVDFRVVEAGHRAAVQSEGAR